MNNKPKDKIVLTPEDARFIEELITENQKHILNIIYSNLGNVYRYLAEDTVHELYLLMCQKVSVLKTHACPQAWIFVAAKYTAKYMMRKNRRDLMNAQLYEDPERYAEMNVFEEALYSIWLENKFPEKLILQLTEREREIYHKLYIEEKTPKETAEELGISVSTVRTINNNLKEKIKRAIE